MEGQVVYEEVVRRKGLCCYTLTGSKGTIMVDGLYLTVRVHMCGARKTVTYLQHFIPLGNLQFKRTFAAGLVQAVWHVRQARH